MGKLKIEALVFTDIDDKSTKLTFLFSHMMGKNDKSVFYRASYCDCFNELHEAEIVPQFIGINPIKTPLSAYFKDKKVFLKNAVLSLEFLTLVENKGFKFVFKYQYPQKDKYILKSVDSEEMSEEEKEIWIDTFCKWQKKQEKTEEKDNEQNTHSIEDKAKPIEFSGLDRYINALKKEKNFLMGKGGTKHKVTHGQRIAVRRGMCIYAFELEAELFLTDDAPVKLIMGDITASGSVIMCEDFQIMISIDRNLGDAISSAKILVEPWKLLDALKDRLERGISLSESVVKSLVFDGPQLATEKTIDGIECGHDAVISHALNNPISVVWGPPGTGKTHVMSELAIDFMQQGKSVLIVSHSNVSVDGVAGRIYRILNDQNLSELYKGGKVLRYGYVRDKELSENEHINAFLYTVKKCPALFQKLKSLQKEYSEKKAIYGLKSESVLQVHEEINIIRELISEEEKTYVSAASVLITTISKVEIDKLFDEKKYDVVMFDEISMAYVLQIVCAATFANDHLICVGDFRQLEPIVQSPDAQELTEDLFTYLRINRNGKPYYHPWLVMLNEQRRMHPLVSAFANKYIYSSLLKDHPIVNGIKDSITCNQPFKNEPVNIVDLTGCYCATMKNDENSRFSFLSALISFLTAVEARKGINSNSDKQNNNDLLSVGIVTPYAAQMRLIRAMLLDYRERYDCDIRCSTIHQFQGSESDVIVFDPVESFPFSKPGYLLSKKPDSVRRLINVAVTRTRGKLITVCNSRFWDNFKDAGTQVNTFCQLQDYERSFGNHISAKQKNLLDSIITIEQEKGPNIFINDDSYISILEKDIDKAKHKIVICLPCGKLEEEASERVISVIERVKGKGVNILCKSQDYKNLPEKWKEITWGSDDAILPIICIDDRIIWYGAPVAEWFFNITDKKYIVGTKIISRFVGERVAEMITALANLEYVVIQTGKNIITKPLLQKNSDTGDEMYQDKCGKLAGYLAGIRKCSGCGQSLKLQKGKSGKYILWCGKCNKTELINKDDINHYICINDVRCPKDGNYIEAKLGQYGNYVKCDNGHTVDLMEI